MADEPRGTRRDLAAAPAETTAVAERPGRAGATTAGATAAGATTAGAPVEHRRLLGGAGLGIVGLLILLCGAWAGIVPYVGPTFGYASHGQPSWTWNLQHSLLYLAPGAVAVVAGFLIMIGGARRVARGHRSVASGVLGVIVAACGAWLVLGPVVWPLFYSDPVFTSGSAWDNFIHQVGYNLGPGLILVLLSGVAIGASARRGHAVPTATPAEVPGTAETPFATRRSA